MTRTFIIIFILLFSVGLHAADTTSVAKGRSFELFEWGMTFGYGFINETLPEGDYGPFLLAGNLEFHAHRKSRDPESPHYFLIFAEPQVNPVLFRGGIKEWEAGCNIGLKYLIRIRDINSLYFHVGSGPHYISLNSPEHQASGYIFADNFGMGYQRLFKRDVSINVGYRFRHASNLNINEPNLGLDNHFLTIGFRKDFPHRVQQRRERKEQNFEE